MMTKLHVFLIALAAVGLVSSASAPDALLVANSPISPRAPALICPDGTQCPGYQTCCLMPNNKYGCCPYNFGVVSLMDAILTLGTLGTKLACISAAQTARPAVHLEDM